MFDLHAIQEESMNSLMHVILGNCTLNVSIEMTDGSRSKGLFKININSFQI